MSMVVNIFILELWCCYSSNDTAAFIPLATWITASLIWIGGIVSVDFNYYQGARLESLASSSAVGRCLRIDYAAISGVLWLRCERTYRVRFIWVLGHNWIWLRLRNVIRISWGNHMNKLVLIIFGSLSQCKTRCKFELLLWAVVLQNNNCIVWWILLLWVQILSCTTTMEIGELIL